MGSTWTKRRLSANALWYEVRSLHKHLGIMLEALKTPKGSHAFLSSLCRWRMSNVIPVILCWILVLVDGKRCVLKGSKNQRTCVMLFIHGASNAPWSILDGLVYTPLVRTLNIEKGANSVVCCGIYHLLDMKWWNSIQIKKST